MSDYTKQQALDFIKREKTISTLCLKALGISFDSFLQFAQFSKEQQQQILKQLIKRIA